MTNLWVRVMDNIIRASVDALCRDGAGQISRECVQRGHLTRQGTKLSLKNTPLGSTDQSIPQIMPFRLIDIFAFPLEQFFLTCEFPIFWSSSSSSSSSSVTGLGTLRKSGKGLIFTPNISTGDGGVHRHQAIVPFLLYDTSYFSHWSKHRAYCFIK